MKDQIEQSKELLVTAKEIRRNKLEYSSLARLIKQEPDRQEVKNLFACLYFEISLSIKSFKVVKKHETLKEELLKMEQQYQKINKSLDNRRKDFACFMLLSQELLRDCNFEQNDAEIDDDIDDDIEKMIIE